MKIDLRKVLLAGTAIVAASAFSATEAQAQHILTGAGTWASGATRTSVNNGLATNAAANDTINTATFLLTVTNNQVASDTIAALDTFTLGAVTGTTGGVTITSGAAVIPNLAVTVASVNLTGAANVTMTNVDLNDSSVNTSITGSFATGGNLAITNTETTTADVVAMTVGGTLDVTGTTGLTAGAFAGASSTLGVTGNATLTGLTTLTAGAGVGADATLTLSGVTNAFTAGLVLDDGVAGSAGLVLNGAGAQTVAGVINGAVAGEGLVQVNNAAGVTFNGIIGGVAGIKTFDVVAGTATTNAAVTATNTTVAAGATLSSGAALTSNVTLTGTGILTQTAAATITGTIDGAALGTGTFNANASTTVTGNIGTTQSLAAVNVANIATLTTGANLNATTTTLNGVGASLLLNGGAAQTIGGAINGGAAADGVILVENTAGVTFTGPIGGGATVGDVIVSRAGFDSAATFQGNVATVNGIVLGDGVGANTNMVTFNGGGAIAVTGTIDGTASDTDNIVVSGAGTSVTANGAVGGAVGGIIDSLTVGAGATFTVNAGLTSAATTLGAGSTLGLGGTTQTIAGDVAAAATGNGAITIADGAFTQTFTGNIGTAANHVGSFSTGAGVNANLVTLIGDLYVDATTLGAANDTLQFMSVGTQTVVGTIDSAGGNLGILNVGNGATATDVTFNSTIGAGVATLASANVGLGATARLNANASFAGAYTNAGTTNLATGVVLTAGSLPTSAGTFNIAVLDGGVVGTLEAVDLGSIASAGVVDLSTSTLNFNFGANIATGTLASWATSSGAVIAGTTITDNSFLYSASLALNGPNVDLTIARNAGSIATTPNNSAVGGVLDTLTASVNPQLVLINANINAVTTATALDAVLAAVVPTVDGAGMAAALDVSNTSFSLMGNRLQALRTGDVVTGMSTGNVSSGARIWTQGFGTTAQQDRRGGIAGYDSDTYGVAFGMDSENILDDSVVGLAFSYANTNADSNNANRTNTNVDSYQITLYADHDFSNKVYVNGMTSYAFSKNDTFRKNIGGVAGLNARGDYDANQFAVRGEVGRDYEYDRTTLTPHIMGDWTRYDADSYTETGAGGAGLSIDSDVLNVAELGVGVDTSWLFENSDGSRFSPKLSVDYRYDFADDNVSVTSSFVGGGAAFKTDGFSTQQSTLDLGAGFTYYSTDNWELTAEYDYEHKEDFDSHSGLFRAAYRF